MEDRRFEYKTFSYRKIRHTPFSQAPMCIFPLRLLRRLRRLMAEFRQRRHYPRYEWESEVFHDMAADWLTRRDFRAIAPRTVKTALCEHVRRKLREMGRVERADCMTRFEAVRSFTDFLDTVVVFLAKDESNR